MAVGFRLREIIEARKGTPREINQSELSRQSGVSFATINRMATNATRQVSLDIINSLCGTLGIKPGDLFTYEQDAKRGRKG